MKSKLFRYGSLRFKAYLKTAGYGWEVGLLHGRKAIFVGNFVHREEALKWWGVMNAEMSHFLTKFNVARNVSTTWYLRFFANTINNSYYGFLDRVLERRAQVFEKAVVRDIRKYRALRKNWTRDELITAKKAA